MSADWLSERLGGDDSICAWPFWSHFGSWQALADHLNTGSRTVGLMRHREDGWVSLSAGEQGGTLLTKILTVGGGVAVNARTRREGSVRIDVLDAGGQPLPEFSGESRAVFRGDSVCRPLAWHGGRRTTLPDTPLRLRIHLIDADLFALHCSRRAVAPGVGSGLPP